MDITKKLPTVIAFCAGYGGIERGLDLSGFEHRVIAYVEIEAYAIANLVAKMETGQLPPAPIYTDLKTFPAELFRGKVDLITGGYPCQPFSAAGQRKGADDPRHLWPYIRRHIQSIRPIQCFFENVEGHISLGLREVISNLEEDCYGATWGIFSAREVGAPHQRKRVYILGDSQYDGSPAAEVGRGVDEASDHNAQRQVKASKLTGAGQPNCGGDLSGANILADSNSCRGRENQQQAELRTIGTEQSPGSSWKEVEQGEVEQIQRWPSRPGEAQYGWESSRTIERGVGGASDGCPDRVDRIRLLGNGVVPQTAAKAWLTLTERL